MRIEKENMDEMDMELDDFDQLQAIVKEASELSMQADTRVDDLQERIDYLEDEITAKQEALQKGSDEWSLEKTGLVAKVAELTNFMNIAEEKNNGPTEKEEALEREIMILKMNLDETTKLMDESKQAANAMRQRMMDGEDLLEYEQMRFKKEKEELDDRIEEERAKLNRVARDFQKEQDKYAEERDGLMQKIDDALSKLTDTEKKMTEEKNKFDEDTSVREREIKDLKANLERAQDQLFKESKRFSAERSELSRELQQQKEKLQRSENQLRDTKEDFQRIRKGLETKLSIERIRVEKLTKELQNETQQFVQEKTDLQGQLKAERTKLTEVETELEEEKKRYDRETRKLEDKIKDGERVRQLKAKQMNNRYNAIREELTEKLEGTKREARKEKRRLTEKYEEKLQDVNNNVQKLQGELVNAESNYQQVTAQLGEMTKDRDLIVREKENSERQYRQTISARNMEITGLKQDVQSLNQDIDDLDGTIESYETSYRQMFKLSLKLTGKRLKNLTRIGRRRKEGDGDDGEFL